MSGGEPDGSQYDSDNADVASEYELDNYIKMEESDNDENTVFIRAGMVVDDHPLPENECKSDEQNRFNPIPTGWTQMDILHLLTKPNRLQPLQLFAEQRARIDFFAIFGHQILEHS